MFIVLRKQVISQKVGRKNLFGKWCNGLLLGHVMKWTICSYKAKALALGLVINS